MLATNLKFVPVCLIEILGPVVPIVDLLHATPHTIRIISRDAVVAAALEVEGEQVRAEVLPERERGEFWT